jgi:uncharacterized protein (TIGR03437 family)
MSAIRCLRVIVAACLGTVATFAQSDDHAFFDNSVVQEIRLTVTESNWQTLRDNYLDNTYYPSDFAWNGATVANVGIRSRGSGSRSPEKPNLTVKFSKYVSGQRFLGLDTVTLKANNQDASVLRETIAMQLYRNFGVPAPREAPARLFINGEFFGLYTIVEAIDEDFLSRVFGESDGYLYEFNPVDAGYHFEYLGDDPAAYAMFEPQTHEKNPDTATLIQLIRTVNQASDADFLAAVSPYLNIHGFVTLIALEDFLSDNDGVLSRTYGMNNFYLYRFQESTESTFIAWDADLTFDSNQRPILEGISTNVLARRAFAIPEFRQLYLDTLLQAATFAGGTGGWLQQEIQRQYGLIAQDARNDPHKQCMKNGAGVAPCDAADFEAAVAALMQFASIRAPFIESQVAQLLPGGPPQLQPGGVVSAAPMQSLLTAGGLATLYGSSFSKTVFQASAFPLPTSLGGVTVTVNGVPAPLLYVSPNQLNVQIPGSIAAGEAAVIVSVNGVRGNTVQATVATTAPGVFAVVHAADSSSIAPDRPAKAGDFLTIYATGLGPVSSPPRDGEAASGEVLAPTLEPATVTIGGLPARVLFSGLAPGMAGVFQVNVEVPAGVVAGTETGLVVSAGGNASPPTAIVTK